MKLLFTGGHLTPALSVLDFILKKGDTAVFIGRQTKNAAVDMLEKAEIENRQVAYESLKAPKLDRHRRLYSLLFVPEIIISIVRASTIIRTHRPDVVVSFGGFLALPVVIAAKLYGLPVFTHEQTHVMGLANRLISLFADSIGLSWANTRGSYSRAKSIITGNPIRFELTQPASKPSWVSSHLPIIYITGGSQGALVLNQTVERLLPKLTKDYYCIHQCGNQADFESLSKAKISLPANQQANYRLSTWYNAAEVAWILSHAKLAVSRAGANTITELIYKQVPAVIIPLPHSGHGEQFHNATALSNASAAILLPQSSLNSSNLLEKIKELDANHQQYHQKLSQLSTKLATNPEATIYAILQKLYAAHTPSQA